MLNNDMALIRDYASNNSQEAFATLISRHVHVVYSIALRQVRDTHVAEEITQSVFILLASKARSLSSETILSGWLCRTARYVSANTLKAQRRRQLREQESQMQADLNEGDSSQWAQIAPLLDEALSYLGQNDHDAIVLRFFHGKELKEVGVTMGLTEDAARMRVNRALQKLRQFFAKKGVTLSAVGLAGAVSANAVQSAPAGLAAAISAAAFSGTAITTATMIATSKGVTMTILQKAIVTSCIAAVGGVGIYEARQAYFRHQTQKSKAEQVDQIRQLQRERDEATNRLASALGEVENARRNSGELLKLRNEIALARKEAEALAAAAKKAQESESELTQSMSNFPPVRTFFSTAMITTGWNKPVVTGGWRTPSGKHAIVMARAVPDENNQQALTIRSSILEYSEEAASATGLARFNTDEQGSTKASELSSEEFEAIQKAASNHDGIEFVSQQAVTTLSGRHSEIQTVDTHQTPAGGQYSTGPVIDVIPTISADGQSVQMMISAHLNYPLQTSQR